MHINDTTSLGQLRLLQFLSAAAPVGSYSYSQGLEWAVEEGWVDSETNFRLWVRELVASSLTHQELPLLSRLYSAFQKDDVNTIVRWSAHSIAVRDTAELRMEERSRAESYLRLLESIESIPAHVPRDAFLDSALVSIAWFSFSHNIELEKLLLVYAQNWLESMIVTGVKIIPLGQSAGQKMLFDLAADLVISIEQSKDVEDRSIGISLPALSMASCCHEVQYSRIYRS